MSPFDVVDATFVAAAHAPQELPPPIGVEVAFAGRSNVGKSSLLNKLTGRKSLARTSSTPGCTRGVMFFEARARDGLALRLVDLPGYGYASRSKQEKQLWADLIEQYLLERVTLAAVVVLVDVRRGLESEERDLLTLLDEPSSRRRAPSKLVVATKLDRLPSSQRKSALTAIESGGPRVVGFSTELADTTEAVWRSVRSAIRDV
ncbi:MAG: ribosome biogenesis GTP-binding protein YihA/YsxC [Polyangiaceae bacterium]